MKRLLDERKESHPIDPTLQAAARLLEARPPLGDDMLRRQRVRARIRRRRTEPVGSGWLLRAALAVMLVGSVAAASPAVVRVARAVHARVVAARVERERLRTAAPSHHRARPANGHAQSADADELSPAVAPVADAPLAAAPVADAPVAAAAPVADAPIVVQAPSVAPAAVARPAAPVANVHAATASVHMTNTAHHRTHATADVDSDAQRLLGAAVRALRHEQAPARAERLLTRYLDAYPDGAAAEDALALAIEATVGRDPARATMFARRYLMRYPSGRWSQLARDTLRR
jgi:hypothetical protein